MTGEMDTERLMTLEDQIESLGKYAMQQCQITEQPYGTGRPTGGSALGSGGALSGCIPGSLTYDIWKRDGFPGVAPTNKVMERIASALERIADWVEKKGGTSEAAPEKHNAAQDILCPKCELRFPRDAFELVYTPDNFANPKLKHLLCGHVWTLFDLRA